MKIRLLKILVVTAMLTSFSAVSKAQPQKKFVLNMYHFNIQYVVGSEASMRRIVKQSFEPLVDFYVEHPEWGADFEMQGMMIKYMAEEHPAVLDKFKRLVNSGQCDLVTFHYADQLLLAYPGHDQEWSLKLNDALLEKHGITRSETIFAQEAQFGEGMAWLGKQKDYNVAVMTTGHYNWFQDDDRFPFFQVHGMDVLVGRSGIEPETGIEVKWAFLGDGELVATGGLSPYFPGLFRKNPIKLLMLEREFKNYEKEGYRIAKVSEYVEAVHEAGYEPPELLPILDSTWRPNDGSGVFQWMGKYVTKWEKDYDMRTQNWMVRNVLVEAEGQGASDDTLAEAWAYMVNAQVSDPTGWYPFPVEINWDYEQMDGVISTLREAPEMCEMTAIEEAAWERPSSTGLSGSAPVDLALYGNAEDAKVEWFELEDMDGAYAVEIAWSGKGDGGVAFPFSAKALKYSPAMMEHTVRTIDAGDIKNNTIHLGLPNGLLGQEDGPWIVRDNAQGTVAGAVDWKANEFRFEVKNGKEDEYRFRFYVLTNADDDTAREFANEINRVRPE